jgi:hypothetical protein
MVVGLNKNPTGLQCKPEKKPSLRGFVSCDALIKHLSAENRSYKFPACL